MYTKDDPRSQLAPAATTSSVPAPTAFAAADYLRFHDMPPQETGPGLQSWYGRGQNFLIAYSRAEAGAVLAREAQEDEYCVILPDAASRVEVTARGETKTVAGNSLIIVPPGPSSIKVLAAGQVVRLVTTKAADLAAKCVNADHYKEAHPNIPPFQPWPEPPSGYKIRSYSLDVAPEPGRFGRIWRCTTFMVNYLDRRGVRDASAVSPHYHDDFEQCSLCLEGEYEHHLRWPWTTNKNMWRDDDHERVGAPSVTIIPPPSIHTSVSLNPAGNQLVDIFSPPRVDFSNKKGWVLNADEYPMP
ncbi:hypothetical protein [Muricoccus radiodurans]|uniref:hypothetical protein n=1 Tax=Muricoccus radiodurans TaxID=2231721 RepID=UPI003CF7EC51